MSDWLADRDALREQYADASNLHDRQVLHAEYSTADRPLREWQFDQFSLGDTADVLSVGCGPGDLWPDVSERVPPGWSLTLSDFSGGMLETAEANLGADLADQARFTVADAAALPFEDDSFDAMTANHMLYHVPDRDAAFGEFARVLRPGGRLYATTNGKNSMRVIYDVLEEVLDHRPARGSEFTLQNGREQLTPTSMRSSAVSSRTRFTSTTSNHSCDTSSPGTTSRTPRDPTCIEHSRNGSRIGRSGSRRNSGCSWPERPRTTRPLPQEWSQTGIITVSRPTAERHGDRPPNVMERPYPTGLATDRPPCVCPEDNTFQ